MKISRSFKGNKFDKTIAKRYLAGEANKFSDMEKETTRQPVESAYDGYIKHEGTYYGIKLTKKGNIIDCIPLHETIKSQCKHIPEHTDLIDFTGSDIGGYLINGLLFRNNYGDGTNTVVVRTFKKEPFNVACSRAEVYANPYEIYVPKGQIVKIWAHDCMDVNEDKPMLEITNAFKIMVHGRKLYVCRTESSCETGCKKCD